MSAAGSSGCRFKDLCLDARDPLLVGRFWAAALGLQPRPHHHRPGVVGLWHGDDTVLWVNPVARAKVGKNRVHLDLWAPEPDRLVALGAEVIAEHADWTVLADPEGNELCAFDGPSGGPPARPFALCVDSDRPEQLPHGGRPASGPGPARVPTAPRAGCPASAGGRTRSCGSSSGWPTGGSRRTACIGTWSPTRTR